MNEYMIESMTEWIFEWKGVCEICFDIIRIIRVLSRNKINLKFLTLIVKKKRYIYIIEHPRLCVHREYLHSSLFVNLS